MTGRLDLGGTSKPGARVCCRPLLLPAGLAPESSAPRRWGQPGGQVSPATPHEPDPERTATSGRTYREGENYVCLTGLERE